MRIVYRRLSRDALVHNSMFGARGNCGGGLVLLCVCRSSAALTPAFPLPGERSGVSTQNVAARTWVTPIAEKIRHDLDGRYQLLDRDKLTRWLMSRASNKELEIIDCRGKPISTGLGCVFEGQLREIFWSFIRPCLEDAIQSSCDTLEQVLPVYAPAERRGALQSVEAIMNGFVERTYLRMVDLDRRMRGKGDPASVAPYNPSREIQRARELIAHKVAILTTHYVRPEPTRVQDHLKRFWSNHWKWIIASIGLPLTGILIKVLVG